MCAIKMVSLSITSVIFVIITMLKKSLIQNRITSLASQRNSTSTGSYDHYFHFVVTENIHVLINIPHPLGSSEDYWAKFKGESLK